jgi:Ni/Co efflux regulator RcnB
LRRFCGSDSQTGRNAVDPRLTSNRSAPRPLRLALLLATVASATLAPTALAAQPAPAAAAKQQQQQQKDAKKDAKKDEKAPDAGKRDDAHDTSLRASCAGDTISGELRADRPAGARVTLVLLRQATRRAPFVSTGKQVVIVPQQGRHTYPFSFDVSALNAVAYRIDGAGESRVVPAASCAPGRQVPDAPLPLMLPLSLLVVLGLPAAKRRRRRAA